MHDGKYPVNPNDKEQKEIRKIKVYTKYNATGHIVNNGNVEKGGIYRIDVFKSKNKEDNKLYFTSYDIFEIEQIKAYEKGKNINFSIKLEYGQGKNNKILLYKNVKKEYDLIMSIYKNDLIRIKTKTGNKSTAYVVGFSGGKLEIKSTIGDGYDIISNNNIFDKRMERYRVTSSTIVKIDKLSISILGEICGL